VILYGHSFGGGAAVKVARKLKEIGVPVLLTIQVDSVGRNDRLIPSNVARAINFYQHDGPFIRGRSEIVAEDSQKTTILGNYQYDYRDKKIDDSALFWLARILEGAHGKLEFDPEVWAQVGQLIVHEIEESSTPTPESQHDTRNGKINGVIRYLDTEESLREAVRRYLDACFLWRSVQTDIAVLGSTALSPSSMCCTTPFLSITMFARCAH
jgi:hypothetical protein